MSAGLVASTPTPGSTAPDESRTVPAITAWANAADGIETSHANSVRALTVGRISHLAIDQLFESIQLVDVGSSAIRVVAVQSPGPALPRQAAGTRVRCLVEVHDIAMPVACQRNI